ncbi:hypothetical protein BT67DRAFT_421740 [Trichocladium antarcticum]|uniref:Uncharacterized protein n=1 Tax=Trichocladium antarcticum TaxID=1450529 RepID=A0AAN6UJU6_9PEZI|nr:hypothetical protein BT67DRAFT_421740 [Trichocladium antarcticum]
MASHHQQDGAPFDGRIHMGLDYSARNTASPPKGYGYSVGGGPPPPRPPREFIESQFQPVWCLLHTYPSIALPSIKPSNCRRQSRLSWLFYSRTTAPAVREPPPRNPNRIKVRTSNFPPSSSVYSQTTPPPDSNSPATVATQYDYRYGGADDISPPSSPEHDVRGAHRLVPGDVSPIDEDDAPPFRRYAAPHSADNPRDNGMCDRPYAPQTRQGTQSPPTTSIPTMRRERHRQSDAATRNPNSAQPRGLVREQVRDQPSQKTPRWDPPTGEQTSSMRGRPSHVKPAEFAQGLGITSHAWSPQQSHPPAAGPSFGDRVRRIAKKAAAVKEGHTDPAAGAFTSSRPGWRGASGRTAIVDPVRDTTEVAPLRIPEKSSRRNAPPSNDSLRRGQTPSMSPPRGSETGAGYGPHQAINRTQPSQPSQAATQTHPQRSRNHPSPLAGDAPSVAARELARDGFPTPNALPSPSHDASPPDSANSMRRKLPPVHTNLNHHHQVSVSSAYPQDTHNPHHSPLQSQAAQPEVPRGEPWTQPGSRFSITTYATSNASTICQDLDDPMNDDQAAVPALPADLHRRPMLTPGRRPSADANSPVTSPIDQFMTSPFARTAGPPITVDERAPPPPALTNPTLARTQATDTTNRPGSRASDMNKTLPPAPPEQTAGVAQDRVGLLNAQLGALANRRININRSIVQMTELMPTDKLMNSAEVVRKRESEKKKVEMLRAELADVQREEYELGLKLHRAYKRLDREGGGGDVTGLWVRRVTG